MIYATDRIRLVQVFVDGHRVNHPVVSNSPPADKALNRHVKIVVYPKIYQQCSPIDWCAND